MVPFILILEKYTEMQYDYTIEKGIPVFVFANDGNMLFYWEGAAYETSRIHFR